MANVDLTRLEDYIIVQVLPKPVADVKDLRELDMVFGSGVYGLWSDDLQSIVAFAFNDVLWKEEDAKAWVAKSKKGDVAVAARSFDDTRSMIDKALVKKYGDDSHPYETGGLWVSELNEYKVVYSHGDEHFVATYTIDADGNVTLGEPELVKSGWRYLENNEPVSLMAFDSVLADGDAAEDDGLTWKEIIRPGTWFKMNTGKRIEVTKEIIDEAFRAFSAGLPRFVSVPADSHHGETRGVIPVEANKGFVPKLRMIGDSLFGGFKFTDAQIGAGVKAGSIADCSVYLQPDVVHPSTGEKFNWVLRHVLLTNDPLVQGLGAWGDIPADGGGDNVTIIHYRQTEPDQGNKGAIMPEGKGDTGLTGVDEIVLTGDAATEYGKLAGLGLTADELVALVGQKQVIEAQAVTLRKKARDMEISRVVLALEGKDAHPGVVQIAGFRHYPVVIVAVEAALRNAPEAMALDADDDGVSGLDGVLLAVVNAIPEDARIELSGDDTGSKGDKKPALIGENGEGVTDKQIDELLEKIT